KTFEPRGRYRHSEREQHAERDAADDGERKGQLHLEEEDDDRIRADAVECEVRERHLAADAEEEVVAERERHPQQQLAVNVVVVVAHEKRGASQDNDRRRPPDKGGGAKRRGVFGFQNQPPARKGRSLPPLTGGRQRTVMPWPLAVQSDGRVKTP